MRTEWVRYGREAADTLRGVIAAAKGDEPLAPVTIVVPANHVGVATRRLLATGTLGPTSGRGIGLAAVTFVTPYRLAELLGAHRLAGSGRRPVSTPVIAAALRAVLADQPGMFAPVAEHPATESALVEAYRELRDLSPGTLDATARASTRAGEVVRIHQLTRQRLAREWYDEQDLIAAAIDELRAHPAQATALGAVVVHLPQLLPLHAAALLRAVDIHSGITVLAGTTGEARADRDVVVALQRLGADAPPPPTFAVSTTVAVERTRVVTTSDADEEVRAAVRAVVAATHNGVSLDRIAILHASPDPYARLVHEHLAAAGIAGNGAAVVPLTARVAGRTVLQLLALPESDFRRADVFAWLAGAPLLHDGRWAPVTAWERISREAAVVAGRRQWDTLLATHAEQLEADAFRAENDPDQPEWRAERDRAEANRTRELRRFVLGVIDDLASAAGKPRPWGEHAQWTRSLLHGLLGGPARRDAWPVAERKAAERVERAIDRLAALDPVEGSVGLDVFTRTLELELDADLGRIGRFGEGVLVGTVGMGVGLDLDLVIVLGLVEGSFPGPVRDESLLPDTDRAAAGGELPLRRHRVDRQHRELLAALAGAERHLLGVPRGDLRRSSARVASRWVLDIASALVGTRWWSSDLLHADIPWVEQVASFDAGLRRVGVPATEQEHRLRSMLAQPSSRPDLAHAGDVLVARGAEVIGARRSDQFTRFDGNLAGLDIPSPADITMSATRLERWADCPFAYLLQHVLSVEVVQHPEDELRITALDKGSLIHSALERFILDVLARPPGEQPGPDDAWTADDIAQMIAIGEELCAEYESRGRTGRPIFWRRDRARLVAELVRFLHEDTAHRREHRTRPLAAELEFGFRGSDIDAVPLVLPDGRTVRFRGKADRVDIADDGTLHIVDYKTGRVRESSAISAENPDLAGTKLQLPVYGVAARLHHAQPNAPVHAEYWFVSAKGDFKRIGFVVTPEVLERVGTTLGTVVAGIEAGVFPSHPTTASTMFWVECHYCDPDALGVIGLRGQWERKRRDPAVALFADLADPPDALQALEPVMEVTTNE